MTPDRDGVEVVMCAHHEYEPATSEDLFGTPLCSGCALGLDARDGAARDWDAAS